MDALKNEQVTQDLEAHIARAFVIATTPHLPLEAWYVVNACKAAGVNFRVPSGRGGQDTQESRVNLTVQDTFVTRIWLG